MRIDILTLFPQFFSTPLDNAIFRRAKDKELVDFSIYNIRDYTHDKHHVVDDYPFGGGAGMLLKPEPVFEALEDALKDRRINGEVIPIILTTPQGQAFSQPLAYQLAQHQRVVILCGHYEGVDDRVREHLVTHEISVGDYVLSGGELPALVIADALVRLLPGVLGSEESAAADSHSDGLLEYPQFTRPADFRGWKVPDILLSGNHAKISAWRREQSILKTARRRPDLLDRVSLTAKEKKWLDSLLRDNTVLPATFHDGV
ncbi:MAG: tRNA (guanosine(37)-N1)-methyltransferase TrmD [Dehalococcoidia bacterium]|jgi:tRNA (guanine37-N1)-methyltransferase|nr:tRNA (guanosine(37)-N1)-methyltransferase TrmD [Dehalococcoidia bacterium]